MSSSMNRGMRAGNPIANIFVIIVGTLVIATSVVLGFFALLIVGSIVLIFAAIFALRIWWVRRKLRGAGRSGMSQTSKSKGGVIEGEFQVIADEDEDG